MSINKITFFIPAYNCAHTVIESVESIMQTNWDEGDELIIVDDCSTDNTVDVLEGCQLKYPDLRIIRHKRNKGGAGARNTAVENAKHELLFCLDSDNILSPHSIASLKEHLIVSEADAASFQNQQFFSKSLTDIHYTWTLESGVTPLVDFLNGSNTPGQHGNYLFTKASWIKAGGYTEGVGALDTTTFGLKQAITGAKFTVLENSFYYHRLQDTSYYMNDAYKKMWSVSLKTMLALMPLFDRIDEDFVGYMFKNRYTWFYDLKNKPIKLVEPETKTTFYERLQKDLHKKVYPPLSIYKRVLNKLKRVIVN